MKKNKIIYWVATGLLSLMLLMSSGMYLFNNEMVQEVFVKLGYPTYIIYPLAFLKISAVTVLLFVKGEKLKEWVYSALFFEFLLAFFAHVMISDGEQGAALVAVILLIVSYLFKNKK